MAKNTTTNPLEAAKLNADGEAVAQKSAKEQARQLVELAAKALPKGVPETSPFAKADHDQLLAQANAANMPLGPFMSADELRIVLEYGRTELERKPVASAPVGSQKRDTPPPVPTQPTPPKRKIRGVPESETDTWRVKNAQPKSVSIGGQITVLHCGSTIELRHYGVDAIRSLAEQGIELEPIGKNED